MASYSSYYGGGRGGRGQWFGAVDGGAQQQLAAGAAAGTFPYGRGGGGAAAGETSSSATLAQAMASRAPEPWMLRRDAVRSAEAAAREVALRVHPTREAERRRQDVVGYLRRLIGCTFGFEVFPFGSVPLKTYLPDGDLDVTVLANTWMNKSVIDDVRHVLDSETENPDAEFQVKGLRFIDADVKLLKCVVENIVVDISFNQIGGVSTFCFLELIDREVGKDHLFKRSIMLIKTWCYHESRILGAHHGLISTYALETLVLYIFNLFHKDLHGPLEAMYRFLEYFSKFDWDKYGISLFGPVLLSSLPDLTIEPSAPQDELLLGHELLHDLLDRIVINSSNGRDKNFRLKHLNIIDPIKGNNNLGRSVSRANFFRIRSAFSFGAQKLGQILMLPSELIPGAIYETFANTLKRHGNGERPDLGDLSSFESLLGPESAPSEHVPSLKLSSITEGENRGSVASSEVTDKESKGAQMHKNSSTYLQGNVQGPPWNKIWFVEHASDFGANSSYLASFSSHSSSSQQNEKESLPPFPQSDMLEISGDLDLHLGCLRKVHYHLEYLFDELLKAVQEAWSAGELDEDFVKALTESLESLETRPQEITIVSPPVPEPRNLSPGYCSRSAEDVAQHVEDQAAVVWQQNVPLSPSGFQFSSPPVSSSDNYPVSWLPAAPRSRGTGTYIPRMSYDMYRERMSSERGFQRRQKPRLADRQFYTLDQWSSDRGDEHISTFQSATPTNQLPVKQKGSSHDSDSSKSNDLDESFPPLTKQTATGGGSKQTATNWPKAPQTSQDTPSSPTTDGSSKVDFVERDRQMIPQPRVMALPHYRGEGNLPSSSSTCQPSSPAAASYHQLKAQVAENIQFGSMGPFSFGLLSAKFEEAFPPLPSSKKPQAPASMVESPEPVVNPSRPQEAYQLRDEAEFPPLKADCR